ncbi:MAG: SPOR domain-containing protein [Gammaproteobacteria bacterium]
MDRKLKERVTGAALLVLFAIIIIPWVLDGDVSAPAEQRPIELPVPVQTIVISDRNDLDSPVMPNLPQPVPTARPAEPTRTPPKPVTRIAADEPPAEPEPQPKIEPKPEPTRVAAAPKPVSPPAPVVEKPAVARPEPARAAPIASDPTSGWAVQVGSFSSQANANKLAARLVGLQYKAFVSRKSVNGRVFYRVRIGPRATRSEAVELSRRLKQDSQAVAIVPHPG